MLNEIQSLQQNVQKIQNDINILKELFEKNKII